MTALPTAVVLADICCVRAVSGMRRLYSECFCNPLTITSRLIPPVLSTPFRGQNAIHCVLQRKPGDASGADAGPSELCFSDLFI